MIASVQKAARLLTALADGKNKPVSLAQLSRQTGISKPTCVHILATLMAEGYVERVSHVKGYMLGPSAFCLARYGKYDDDFIAVCRPVMQWLRKKTAHTVILAVVRGGRKFIIDFLDAEDNILPGGADILPDDIYRTATGRVILANLDRNRVLEIYEQCGAPPPGHWDGVDSPESLLLNLAKLDKRGVVTVRDDTGTDAQTLTFGYAAALFCRGECVGALGVAVKCPKTEYPAFVDEQCEIQKLLLKASAEIGRRLAYS
ncbi:MAG: IclR family transcriptional regulator [Eubacteriales bacterium]